MVRPSISSASNAIMTIVFLLPITSTAEEHHAPPKAPTCTAVGTLVRLPELPEASGIAASKRSPGRFWAVNDTGDPVLVALDSTGTVIGRVRVPGAKLEDWEAVAVGPCSGGSCIYIGDIGDNHAHRRYITIYRIPEPADPSGVPEHTDVFRARYPDGPNDAETLLVTPAGEVVIVTKGDTGPVGLYRLPSNARTGDTVTLQPIGKPRDTRKARADERITDGAVSPSGAWVALRTNTAILLYRVDDLMSGDWREASRVSVRALDEPQGEGVAFGDETSVVLVGEGGGRSRGGTFGRLRCTL